MDATHLVCELVEELAVGGAGVGRGHAFADVTHFVSHCEDEGLELPHLLYVDVDDVVPFKGIYDLAVRDVAGIDGGVTPDAPHRSEDYLLPRREFPPLEGLSGAKHLVTCLHRLRGEVELLA